MIRRRRSKQNRVVTRFVTTDGVISLVNGDPRVGDEVSGVPARYSIGFVDPARIDPEQVDLVTEFLSGKPATPWISSDARESALRFLPMASWIEPGLRARLVDHVRRMPWYDYEEKQVECDQLNTFHFVGPCGCRLYELPDSIARSKRVWLPARWSRGNYDEAPGGILDEMQTGAFPIPWLSEQHREKILAELREGPKQYSSYGSYPPDVFRRLIRHVEKTPCWLGADDADYLRSLTGPDSLD